MNILRTVKAVAWSFIGIRKNSESQQDMALNALHVIVVGLAGAALFIIGLVVLVRWVAG